MGFNGSLSASQRSENGLERQMNDGYFLNSEERVWAPNDSFGMAGKINSFSRHLLYLSKEVEDLKRLIQEMEQNARRK